jgi:hypothetical protein
MYIADMMPRKFASVTVLVLLGHVHLAQIPFRFIANRGQWPEAVHFGARIPGGNMYIGSEGFHLVLYENEPDHVHSEAIHQESHGRVGRQREFVRSHYLLLELAGARLNQAKGITKAPEWYNFYLGRNRERWAGHVPAYRALLYADIYPGIDLQICSWNGGLKYDFRVSPGADPFHIRIRCAGAASIEQGRDQVIYHTAVGTVVEKLPEVYQYIGGQRVAVPCEYRRSGDEVMFHFPQGYDTCYELVIDPLLIFSTFSGSTADNWGSTATPGERGTLYSSGIVRYALGGTFPATPGAFQTEYGGNYDVALLKYDSTGQQLLYASFLGGSSNETSHTMVTDYNGDLLVMGTTSSDDFPTTEDVVQPDFEGGPFVFSDVIERYPFGSDIFIARISADGAQLKACTYLGGTDNDGLNAWPGPLTRNYGDEMRGDIITDSLGNVYICSVTASEDFPTLNGAFTDFSGLTDAIVVKLSPDLDQILWSTFLGGSQFDAAYSIQLDSAGNVLVAGGTTSDDFPLTPQGYQQVYRGNVDGWIARIDATGTTVTAFTYTGTHDYDQVYFLDMNKRNEVFVFGQTTGNIPVTPGCYHNPNSGQFIQRFSADLTTLIYSTVFGSGIGMPNISPTAFMVNDCNNLYAAGWGGFINSWRGYWPPISRTTGMPVTTDAYQQTTLGSDFYFLVLSEDASELLYATFLGGNQSYIHVDGGTSRFDKTGIVYHAVCAGCFGGYDDFPTTPGAWSRTNNSLNCNNAAFKFDLATLRARLRTNTVDFSTPGITQLCYPDTLRLENLSTGGEIYEWDLGDGTRHVLFTKESFLHQYQQEGVYTIKLKAIDLNTCTAVDSTWTVVRVFKNDASVQGDDHLCKGDSYRLTASGGVSYLWRSADGSFSSTLPQPVVEPSDTTTYFVSITDAEGCVLKDTVTIYVIPDIDLKFSYSFISDCFSRPQIHLKNHTDRKPDEMYFFDLGDGFITDLSEVVHMYNADNHYTIKLVGIKKTCLYERSVTIPVFTIRVPNVITPEASEGFNDTFVVQYGDAGHAPFDFDLTMSLVVVNRWGKTVYQSNDYRNNWSASGLEEGIYFYELKIGKDTTCKGWLHVIK